MAEYTVTFARSARRELESLHPPLVQRILSKIEALTVDPRPPGCRKLRGENDLWRIRIGDYRVVYAIYDGERRVDVTAVRHRREAYE
ncbi:MAG: type II toxin-antitoxin system RelE family toxin [Candidatus Methylomirabilis sp.]